MEQVSRFGCYTKVNIHLKATTHVETEKKSRVLKFSFRISKKGGPRGINIQKGKTSLLFPRAICTGGEQLTNQATTFTQEMQHSVDTLVEKQATIFQKKKHIFLYTAFQI